MARIVLYTGYHADYWSARSMSAYGLGGTETTVCYLANELADMGHQVFVVGDKVERVVIDGVQFIDTDTFINTEVSIIDVLIGVGYLHYYQIFKDHKFDVLEHIFWLHNTEPYLWYRGVEMTSDQIADAYNNTDRVWVPSEWAKEFIPFHTALRADVEVVPNGVSSSEWLTQPPAVKFANVHTQLNFVYTSCMSRGLDQILDMWPVITSVLPQARLHIAYPQYSLNIVDAQLNDRVFRIANSDTWADKPHNIIVHGSLPKNKLYSLLEQSHIWLYPSNYEETFCINAVEAIGHGLVPIITDVGNLKSFAKYTLNGGVIDCVPTTEQVLRSILQTYDELVNRLKIESTYATIENNMANIVKEYDWNIVGKLVHSKMTHNFIMKPSSLIDAIYIITSDRQASKTQVIPKYMLPKLRKLGIRGVKTILVDAIDGRLATPEVLQNNGMGLFNWKMENSSNDWWNRDITPGEIGCTLSHLWVWEHARNAKHKGILVLEDDFYPQDTYHTLITESNVPTDWDMIYLGRNLVPGHHDTVTDNPELVKPGYSYCTHAYMLSGTGISKLLDHNLARSIMPIDEFLPATYGYHPRADLSAMWKDTIAYAVTSNKQIIQKDSPNYTQTGFTEAIDENLFYSRLSEILYHRVKTTTGSIPKRVVVDDTTPKILTITDDDFFNNRQDWERKYLCNAVVQRQWDLIIDQPIPGVMCFNMFKPEFCEELISMAENANLWVSDRHDFYPTTDFLISELKLGNLYNALLTDYIVPAAKYFYGLEGSPWKSTVSENFMAKYTTDNQTHLGLHHDASDITALVNLSHPSSYTGGGTYFDLYKQTHIGQQGQVTIHPGKVSHRHGGRPILTGKRYILVSFIKST